MTPKEKANKLFGKFAMYLRANLMYDEEANEDAKQCALIAVDEIINSNPYKLSLEGKFLTEHITYDINYWEEVKQEIEKL
jgi:hypothetical protein